MQRRGFMILVGGVLSLGVIISTVILAYTPKIPVRLAVAEQPAFALVYIANERGFFKDEGLDITLHTHSLGRDALKEVVDGTANLATVFDIPLVRNVYEGKNLVVLTTLHTATQNHALVALKNSGVHQADGLRKKRVAITKGTSAEFYLDMYLREHGIDPDDLEIVNKEPQQLLPALETNEVAAAVLFNPYLHAFTQRYNPNEVTILRAQSYTEMSVLAGGKDYVSQNPLAMIKILRALNKAQDYIQMNQAESITLIDEWLENYNSGGVRAMWDQFTFEIGLTNLLLLNMEREAQFYYESGAYETEPPNFHDVLEKTYLEEVKPQAVTVN